MPETTMLENNTAITQKERMISCCYVLNTSHFFLFCVLDTIILSFVLCCFMLSVPVLPPLIHHPLFSVSSMFFSILQLLDQYPVLLSLFKPTLGEENEEDPERMQEIPAWVSIDNL